ncbi:unnamed protein product, partial [Mesorhabditis belari]|uniref:Uncharacterized protein n=1 Tax=Mesorhabditis belari TaxID=2138241 RepID=A0AAF3EWI5_9BILA
MPTNETNPRKPFRIFQQLPFKLGPNGKKGAEVGASEEINLVSSIDLDHVLADQDCPSSSISSTEEDSHSMHDIDDSRWFL